MSDVTPETKTTIAVVELPSLSPEQEMLLRQKWERERLAAASAAASAPAPAALLTGETGEHIYTNMRPIVQFVPDLGSEVGGVFSAEQFKPGECKDLAIYYSVEELRKSRHLIKLREAGHLKRGRHLPEFKEDPLTVRARRDPDGKFDDPVVRSYDEKLRALEEKERKQNMIRRGY